MPERALVSIVKEICKSKKITLQSFSYDWVLRLDRAQQTKWIFGYDFDLNTCTTQQLCKDKSAGSDALGSFKIPRLEHVMFMQPQNKLFVPKIGTWKSLHELFERWKCDVVVKPNEGTGGNDVVRARSVIELEDAVSRLFSRHRTIAISPFVSIKHEFRFVVLDNVVKLAYEKLRPTIRGDGRSTRMQLLLQHVMLPTESAKLARWIGEIEKGKIDLNEVLPHDEVWPVNWRHNLGQGSSLELIDPNSVRYSEFTKLALSAAHALNVRFGSVDIVENESGERMILEINSGVMMESFVEQTVDGRALAMSIYGEAIEAMFVGIRE
ncbi:MAG TPA: hypothetical protein PK402_06560 [Tepidisphaeraceae bacterium]|nr:hypothetical protein [Tepidisphaeraceae bacterium]